MFSRIFPIAMDSKFRGLAPAYWLLIPIVVLKLLMGANAVLITRLVASTADHLPLASFGDAGTQAVLNLLSKWGLEQVMLALLGLLAIVRYRAMIPLAYLILLAEHGGRYILSSVYPIHRVADTATGGPSMGVLMNYALFVALVAGTFMALIKKRVAKDEDRAGFEPYRS